MRDEAESSALQSQAQSASAPGWLPGEPDDLGIVPMPPEASGAILTLLEAHRDEKARSLVKSCLETKKGWEPLYDRLLELGIDHSRIVCLLDLLRSYRP